MSGLQTSMDSGSAALPRLPNALPSVPLPDAEDDSSSEDWQAFRMVLEDAPQKLTRQDILAEWPPDFARPDPATL